MSAMYGGAPGGQRWGNRTQYDRLATNADQMEWQAVLNGAAHVMAGTMDNEMAEEADQGLGDGVRTEDLLEGKSRVLELAQGTTTEIILERIRQLGDAYPFRHVENSLHYQATADQLPMYELLLGISQAPSLTVGEFTALPRLFEQLSKLAGMAFLGPTAAGFHTGWPRPETHTRFKSVIDQLRTDSGKFFSEWEWRPGSDLPADPIPALIKDGGMDIVAWRPWADQRGAHLYLLGQCACGGDWLNKTTELDMKRLSDWFHPPRVEPLRSFFTPHYAVQGLLREHSRTAGLMFDRVRIVHMLREPHIRQSVAGLEAEIRAALAIAKLPPPPTKSAKAGRAPRKMAAKPTAAARRPSVRQGSKPLNPPG